jgi:hypothetical protein
LQSPSEDTYTQILQSDGSLITAESNDDSSKVFQDVTFFQGYSYQQFQEDLQNGKTGYSAYQTSAGVSQFAYYMPLGINGWYLLSVVPMASITQYSTALSSSAAILLFVTIVIFILIFAVILYLQFHQRVTFVSNTTFHHDLCQNIKCPYRSLHLVNNFRSQYCSVYIHLKP